MKRPNLALVIQLVSIVPAGPSTPSATLAPKIAQQTKITVKGPVARIRIFHPPILLAARVLQVRLIDNESSSRSVSSLIKELESFNRIENRFEGFGPSRFLKASGDRPAILSCPMETGLRSVQSIGVKRRTPS